MKKIILIFFLIFLAVLPLLPDSTLEKEFKVVQGEELEINLKSGGSIEVLGWDQTTVAVKVLFKDKKPEDWDVRFTRISSGIKVESRHIGSRSDLRGPEVKILVPVKFDLKLKTMGGGIHIDNVEGEMTGRTMGGELNLKNLKGKINLKTLGGEIVLRDSDIDGRLKTLGGRVLIENVVGDIRGTSLSGNVVYRNVKTRRGEATGKVVCISTMGGSINVSDASEGADVHTLGGNIHIRSAKKFVKAKTLSGDIKVDDIDGWVNASTLGGDIRVFMTGDPAEGKREVTLSSLGGDVSLAVPAGLSMDIHIELVFTKKSSQEYDITSDFELKKSVSDKWDCSNGSPKKSILGKAVVRGGKNTINIKTINGNIYLKKNK